MGHFGVGLHVSPRPYLVLLVSGNVVKSMPTLNPNPKHNP